MPSQIITSDLLVDLSTNEQQLLSGGFYYKGGDNGGDNGNGNGDDNGDDKGKNGCGPKKKCKTFKVTVCKIHKPSCCKPKSCCS
ncbi:hypothetical protein FNW02_02375 [Komarekiella sp. 'clone 1']|uniref:Uncharacterized protein n=1 Tax=Komarekiella delphini-convector SJRDD-AB1 TaxID=2593771 RepID=A0AA40ST16_9NOST|nr:hypothetical protein [Komarekiella delphini-convector]MBD6614738.1 hypothetical protein [Komarekiella delphini-convector SJRDD-AB1]